MRQLLHAGGSADRIRSGYVVALAALILALPLLAGCGLNDILGRKATATVPSALLATPAETATASGATTQPTATPAATTAAATATIAAASTAAVVQATTAAQPTGAAGAQGSYTVVQGDTLSGIAKQFGITAEELAAANGITDQNKLSIGQTLVIPAPGSVTAPPVASATQQPQQQGGSPELVQFGQDIQLEQIGGWLQALGPMITTMSANPSGICTSPEFDALVQQGQGLLGGLNAAETPPGMAELQGQLGSGIQGINDGLASIKTSMCEQNDSVAATTGLLQLTMSLAQVQSTVDSIGQTIEQGVSG
ncbi:MAG: LysM peptidoglycan-binding domain-containing protein [Anaerolineae bacterium]